MSAKNVTVSATMSSANAAERALDHLIGAGFGTASVVARRNEDGTVELAAHCESTEQMDAAKQVFHDTAGIHISARTENERIFEA